MFAITQGTRPPRPTHPTFTENLWTLMRRCWDHDPHLRPEVSEVLQLLTLSVCKRLISRTLATYERILLIATIFSDDNQVKVVGHVTGDDAQTIIDVIDEVGPCTISCSKDKPIDFHSNLHILLIRR
jgi:anti-sigma factor ChrR (cupin superfamily)